MKRTVDLMLGVLIALAMVSGLVWMLVDSEPVNAGMLRQEPAAQSSLPPAPGAQDPAGKDKPAPDATASASADEGGKQPLQDLQTRLKSEDPEALIAAAIEAGRVAPPASEVMDRLLELSLYPGSDKDSGEFVRLAAERSLEQIGEPLNARLQPFLESTDDLQFSMGMVGVKALGPRAVQWLPLLKTRLESSTSHRVRMAVLFAMEPMGPLAEPLLDPMINLLKDPDFNIQQATCRAMAAMGPVAKRAGPDLVDVVDKGFVSARSRALTALGAIGPVEGIDTVGILSKWMTAFSVTDRERALEGLALYGPAGVAAKDGVEELMYRDDASVRPHAAYTYYRLTGELDKPLDVLGQMLSRNVDKNPALLKLAAMGAVADPLIEQVAALLTDEEAGLRESALAALAQLGPGIARVRDQLQQVVDNDEDLILKDMAQNLLARIDRMNMDAGKTP